MPPKARTPKAPRTRKTPREKAQHAHDVAQRRVTALATQKTKLEAELEKVFSELKVATRRRDYLSQSPDLEQPPQADEAQDTKETP